MKKGRAVILTADQFEDFEVFFPYFRLLEEGWEVKIAAPTKKTIHGESGHWYELNPDMLIGEVNPDDFNFLYIPGGAPDGAPAAVRKIKKAQEIAQDFMAKKKPMAAMCHGPWTLADAGVVKGKHVTSYWHDGVPESLKEAGAIWEDKEV